MAGITNAHLKILVEALAEKVSDAVSIMKEAAGHVIVLDAKLDDLTIEVKTQVAKGDQTHIALSDRAALAQGTANKALEAIEGNGKPGLKADIARVDSKLDLHKAEVMGGFTEVNSKIVWIYRGLGAILLAVTVNFFTNIMDMSQPAASISQDYQVIIVTATPSLASYMPTATPRPPRRPKPAGYIPTDTEIDALGRLCSIEVRDMTGVRDTACLSVVGTVMARTERGIMSDGTIQGTITRGCGPDTLECNFPAHVWWGCDGIQSHACAYSYPEDIEHFTRVVESYFEGARGVCDGRLFYGIKHFDTGDCIIQAANGLWQGWHN